ncbi:hypothetical protein Hypma_005930, partial [Hypsizygus marmoreus]
MPWDYQQASTPAYPYPPGPATILVSPVSEPPFKPVKIMDLKFQNPTMLPIPHFLYARLAKIYIHTCKLVALRDISDSEPFLGAIVCMGQANSSIQKEIVQKTLRLSNETTGLYYGIIRDLEYQILRATLNKG